MGADLRAAHLSQACLQGANFRRAQLHGALFGEACLFDADLTGADLGGDSAVFNGALFCNTRMPDGRINDRDCEQATACCQRDSDCGDELCQLEPCETAVCQGGSCVCVAVADGPDPSRQCAGDPSGHCCEGVCCQGTATQCNLAGLCCAPNCAGRECGPDGCGGSGTCGPGCLPGQRCDEDGQCTGTPTCSPQTCATGCCDGSGACQAGTTPPACGTGGAPCAACRAGQRCTANGQCVCDAASCPDGCCQANLCLSGLDPNFCGHDGAACQRCASTQVCRPDIPPQSGGLCVCIPQSCPTGCCSAGPNEAGTCEAGTSDDFCGAGGAVCRSCGTCQFCTAQGTCQQVSNGVVCGTSTHGGTTLRCCNGACPDPDCVPSGVDQHDGCPGSCGANGENCCSNVGFGCDEHVSCICLTGLDPGIRCGSDNECQFAGAATACICGTCQPPPSQCRLGCRTGCCDGAEICQPGNTFRACGIGAASCTVCSGGTPACVGGVCVACGAGNAGMQCDPPDTGTTEQATCHADGRCCVDVGKDPGGGSPQTCNRDNCCSGLCLVGEDFRRACGSPS